MVIAPGTIGEQLLPPLHLYRNDFPSDASSVGGTRNSQTAQDPGCMQGGVGLEVSVVLRHLEFDNLCVGAHCHAAVLSLYHCEPA